jgi:lysozyme
MNLPLAVEVAAALARRFEGLRLRPYLCQAGVPTIGFGATYYENRLRVTLRDAPITKERAESLLLWMVKTQYLPSVLLLCPGINDPHRLAAIIDFAFNLGNDALKVSTLRRRINAGRWDDVPTELMKWKYAGGKALHGLVIRRQMEADLCA